MTTVQINLPDALAQRARNVTAQVELIVSGDRHLLSLASHQGISIVRVREALQRIAHA